jgi:hypothetical protein
MQGISIVCMCPIGCRWYASGDPLAAPLDTYIIELCPGGWGHLTQIKLYPLLQARLSSWPYPLPKSLLFLSWARKPSQLMRLCNFITAPGGVSLYLLTISSLTENVLARPSPEPKASWVRKGHGRKAISNVLKGKRDNLRRSAPAPSNVTGSCAGAAAGQISAPKLNVWAELEDTDAAAVVAWLFSQPEFNLTTTEKATEWDNTV